MRMKRKILFYAFLAFVGWGCQPWVIVGGPYSSSNDNFEVHLPDGWRKLNFSPEALRITRDGLALQEIRIAKVEVTKELPHTKKKLATNMLPQEAAEVLVDDFKADANIMNQQILENAPATIGGRQGFKIVYTYKTKQGLAMKASYYGVLLGGSYYCLVYQAPSRHYFLKDYPAFEKVKETFRFLKADAT